MRKKRTATVLTPHCVDHTREVRKDCQMSVARSLAWTRSQLLLQLLLSARRKAYGRLSRIPSRTPTPGSSAS